MNDSERNPYITTEVRIKNISSSDPIFIYGKVYDGYGETKNWIKMRISECDVSSRIYDLKDSIVTIKGCWCKSGWTVPVSIKYDGIEMIHYKFEDSFIRMVKEKFGM